MYNNNNDNKFPKSKSKSEQNNASKSIVSFRELFCKNGRLRINLVGMPRGISGYDVCSLLKKTRSAKSGLVYFRDLLNSYMNLTEQIQRTSASLENLNIKKMKLEEEIVNNPYFEEFKDKLDTIKGLKK